MWKAIRENPRAVFYAVLMHVVLVVVLVIGLDWTPKAIKPGVKIPIEAELVTTDQLKVIEERKREEQRKKEQAERERVAAEVAVLKQRHDIFGLPQPVPFVERDVEALPDGEDHVEQEHRRCRQQKHPRCDRQAIAGVPALHGQAH